jgi:hypothetical protein
MLYVGIDLGKEQDYTAIALIEAAPPGEDVVRSFELRGLDRWPLRTPYPEIADDVAEIMRERELQSPKR